MNAIFGNALIAALLMSSNANAVELAAPAPMDQTPPPAATLAADFAPGHLPFSLTIRDELRIDYDLRPPWRASPHTRRPTFELDR